MTSPFPYSQFNPRPHGGTGKPGAFTLMELLVVIVIIAVLVLLSFAGYTRLTHKAHATACSQNLRGIGSAIVLYTTDNNGRLPGPLNVGQSALYNPKATSPGPQLVHYIAPYMGTTITSGDPFLVPGFGCPSIMKRIDASNTQPPIVYRMGHDDLMDVNGKKGFPWIWNNPAGTSGRPWRLDQIDQQSAGKVYAMIEQDQTMGGSWTNNGATEPAHGEERMALYFDWTVRLVPTSEWKSP
jgi:prepilin-type N-terminal cleavage/methylation domain-containing protein